MVTPQPAMPTKDPKVCGALAPTTLPPGYPAAVADLGRRSVREDAEIPNDRLMQAILDGMTRAPAAPTPEEQCPAYTLTPPSSHCSRPNLCIILAGHEGPHKVLVFS